MNFSGFSKAFSFLVLGIAFCPAVTAQSGDAIAYTFSTPLGYVDRGSTDGVGNKALFSGPNDVAVDGSGNLFVADAENNLIRKITPGGVVVTFAGAPNQAGNLDGIGSVARFSGPKGVAVDSVGNIFVADSGNGRIRKISSTAVVQTLPGVFASPTGVAVDSAGNVYVADYGNNTIGKITPGGDVVILAGSAGNTGATDGMGANARFNQPADVAVDDAGNLYVADSRNCTIRKVTAAGLVSTFAGTPGTTGNIDGSGEGATFSFPRGLTIDSSGFLYVGDTLNNTIRKISPAGTVTTIAGSNSPTGYVWHDGTGVGAQFYYPVGLTVDNAGNLFVADSRDNVIRKITPAAEVSTVAGTPPIYQHPTAVAVDRSGNVYVADEGLSAREALLPQGGIRKITPRGVETILGNEIIAVEGIAVDSLGNLYVTASGFQCVKKIDLDGTITIFAGAPNITGSNDGVGSAARFWSPLGLAIDAADNVYVTDPGNHTIRKITPAGLVSTLAGSPGNSGIADGLGSDARFNSPFGIAVDTTGNVYVADYGTYTIRKIDAVGLVTTFAGGASASGGQVLADGTGTAAGFYAPRGIAVDGAGNVYVADTGHETIRKISPAGVVVTIAGSPGKSGRTDGTGQEALFSYPWGIAVDEMGAVYVADYNNSRVRKGYADLGLTISDPRDAVVAPAQNAAFSAGVVGDGATPSFQWQRFASGGAAWTSLSNNADHSGANTDTLLIHGATLVMNGDLFRCVVTNGLGSSATNPAALSVVKPATWARDVLLMNHTTVSSEVALSDRPADWRIGGTGDFNGDGHKDVIWQNVVTGQHSIVFMNGTTEGTTVDLGTTLPVWLIAGTGDFNHDGQSDILWENSSTGEHSIWLMNGTTNIGYLDLGAPTDTSWRIAGTGDFNRDGQTDILWQNIATGQHSVWLMDGTTNVGDIELDGTDPTWHIIGTGDFDGDAKTDILWQNTITGKTSLWLMDGTTVLSKVDFGTADPTWQAAGVGDFNNDGKVDVLRQRKIDVRNDLNGDGFTDILWQNSVTGQHSIWLMNGTTYLGGYELGATNIAWQIAGTGDFNADGQTDILWYNLTTGQHSLWLMHGTNYTGGVELETTDPVWQIGGTGEFNGDGQTDILFQNVVTGERSIWLMNGTTHTGTVSLLTTDPAWQMVGSGDFNADGHTDILWQNITTGEHSLWLMTGTVHTGTVDLGTTSPLWQMAGTGDFNADGSIDILWQNTATGQRSIWLMNGTTNIGNIELGTTDPAWVIVN